MDNRGLIKIMKRPTKTIYNPVTGTTYIISQRVVKDRKKGYISGKWENQPHFDDNND
jgi:hypothetical protein